MKVLWSPLAEQRAAEAVEFIAQDRPQVAAAWLDELIERVAHLDRFARRGRAVPEIGLPAYREIFHAPYRVIYRVSATGAEILTIRHARRGSDPAEVRRGV